MATKKTAAKRPARRPARKPSPKKNKGGRPPHEPTDAMRKQVSAFSGLGVSIADIASHMGIAENTLRLYYEKEIVEGRISANAQVAKELFRKATSKDAPGAAAAAMFWLKTRAGWKETSGVEHTGSGGGAIKVDYSKVGTATDEELEELEDALRRTGIVGGDPEGESA